MAKRKKVAHPEIVLGVRLEKAIDRYNEKWLYETNAFHKNRLAGKMDAYLNCLDWVKELFNY